MSTTGTSGETSGEISGDNGKNRRDGGQSQRALCITAGVAAAVLGTIGTLLAAAAAIALCLWGLSNYGQEIGYVIVAAAAGTGTGGLAAVITTIVATYSWNLLGEPISQRCRERAGVAQEEQHRAQGPKKAPMVGAAIGAAAGIVGIIIFLATTQGTGISTLSTTVLSGVILGAAIGAGLGIGLTIFLDQEEQA